MEQTETGAFYDDARDYRAAARGRFEPVLRVNDLGFRVAAVPVEASSK